MLDNLRDQEPASPFLQDDSHSSLGIDEGFGEPQKRRLSLSSITAPQRFILAAMMLVEVGVLGVMALVVTGKIVP